MTQRLGPESRISQMLQAGSDSTFPIKQARRIVIVGPILPSATILQLPPANTWSCSAAQPGTITAPGPSGMHRSSHNESPPTGHQEDTQAPHPLAGHTCPCGASRTGWWCLIQQDTVRATPSTIPLQHNIQEEGKEQQAGEGIARFKRPKNC